MAKDNGKEDMIPENINGDDGGINTKVIPVSGLYENWFLDYASYVILERAVPAIEDGLKPVQRRILHAMKEMDDGRFHKVANIIGQTMQYHPHGDAAIGDALVNLGQKNLLIDTQGNWGDIRTGDPAAAARYIEARLSKFALEVSFNSDTTVWQTTYDGRKQEPVTLPMKFPLLLAQGVEGIAVGLATKILPHNFRELIRASIDILKGKKPVIYPDFLTGGSIDVTNYNDGLKGGRIRARAKIENPDKKTLLITELPFGTTTNSLIDSILKANDKGKIKVKKISDNTAKDVEIRIDLPAGVSPDVTIDALYAFTDCEVSISPNACVIVEDKPMFIGISEILKVCTGNTVNLLKRELEIKLQELQEKWHFSSLEKIFIEKRIYRDIEECETWEAVITAIDKGLEPYKKLLFREVTEADIVKLTEIKIKRISKYDSFKADESIKKLEADIEETKYHLDHLIKYAIAYYENLDKKYGKGRERKTEIKTFDTIDTQEVAMNNVKLYVDRKGGFIGYGLKKNEFVCDCSDIDDVIVIRKDGKCIVTRIAEKTFVGKDIIYTGIWKRGDERMTYHMIYTDGKTGKSYVKRFPVTSITRDKEYDIGKGKNVKVQYFSANPNSEEDIVSIQLTQSSKAKKKVFEFDFGELSIKGRNAKGNILTRYPIRKVTRKEIGGSTLGGRDIWLDETVGRLNHDNRGIHLGSFDTSDTILVLYKNGSYEMTGFELTNRYDMNNTVLIKKFDPSIVVSVVYYEADKKNYFVKRFHIETSSLGQKFSFVGNNPKSTPMIISIADHPIVEVKFLKGKKKISGSEHIDLSEFIDIKGWKSLGIRLSSHKVQSVKLIAETFDEKAEEMKQNDLKTGVKPLNRSDENPSEAEKKLIQEKDSDVTENKGGLDVGTSLEWDLVPDKKKDNSKNKTKSKDSNKGNSDQSRQGTLF